MKSEKRIPLTSRLLSAPIHVFWNITNKCNLYCKHCSANAGERLPAELTTSEALRLTKKLIDAKVLSISFTGGEPLLREDLFTIISAINGRMSVSLSTNGTMITNHIVHRLIENKIKKISVSLDGSRPETNDFIRGGSFDKIIKGIERLSEINAKISIVTVITKSNYKDIPNLVKLAYNLNVDNIGFTGLKPVGRAKSNLSDLMPTPKEKARIAELIYGLSEEYGNFIGSEYQYWYSLFKQDPDFSNRSQCFLPCDAGKASCAITADGNLVPCNILMSIKCGNVREKDFLTIWKNSEVLNKFRELSNSHLEDTAWKCKNCKFNSICAGGCRAAAFNFYGSWTAPDPMCWYEPDV